MINPRTVLFDLDGTLLDTAPDMAYALNQLRAKYQLAELDQDLIRPHVSHGVKALIKLGFNLHEDDKHFSKLAEEYLDIYQAHATNATKLFPDMEKVLDFLDSERIFWGIVTNKPTRFTREILKDLELETRALCVVCGDTLTKRKPDPEPLLYACEQIDRNPNECLYIGDSEIDVRASKAAGIGSLVALYGYINTNEDPFSWEANGYVREPIDIIPWLQQHPLLK